MREHIHSFVTVQLRNALIGFLLGTLALGVKAEDAWHTANAQAAANQSLYWGTYRPNLYFGTRTRSPNTLLTGLMWYGVNEISPATIQNIRHTCEQGDGLSGYSWQKHDGRTYGTQGIRDPLNHIIIQTDFIKNPEGEHGGDWVVRVTGSALEDSEISDSDISVLFYIGMDGEGEMNLEQSGSEPTFLRGKTRELGEFAVTIVDHPDNRSPRGGPYPSTYDLPDLSETHVAGFDLPSEHIWQIKDAVQRRILSDAQEKLLKYRDPPPHPAHVFFLEDRPASSCNVYVFQKILKPPFQFDVVFLSKSARSHGGSPNAADADRFSGAVLNGILNSASQKFDSRFEDSFRLYEKGFNDTQVAFAQSLLGNMIGGLGYFYGTSIVDRALKKVDVTEPVDYIQEMDDLSDDYFDADMLETAGPQPAPQHEGPTSLFTAVPSRPFFPRGFLWDEGFHQLLIGQWDNDLSLDVVAHWAALIDDDGWVAREQILGEEARSKVPAEFQTQYPHFANPPTLVMSIKAFMERLRAQSQALQEGGLRSVAATDINVVINRHLLDKELAMSFLRDIYRRFKKQYEWFRETQWGDERVGGRKARGGEGYRWRGRQGIHTLTSGLDDYPRAVLPHSGELHVDLLSWMAFYARTLKEIAQEIGEKEDTGLLFEDERRMLQSLEDLHWNPASKTFCDLSIDEKGRSYYVVHKGYVSLFPLLLGLLGPDSPYLGSVLDLMEDPRHLWTPFGLASLSKDDEYYNTGENYWRGPIWININYLALSSLYKNYIHEPGPHQERAQRIYRELRRNLIENVFKEYRRTGYVWEQYSSIDGTGKRSHPFTGWTALIVLIMAEIYT
ncbi:mannosyl-oligosaccharide glucosidase [Spizellomyces punctatus DAOM BR117]|uniref:Mannosyl-oligosaccharide glucosidase n=1 Tax=Spizellomyces punctatus (strain DAOM BR117) TaxID=645134 RepID=A0A0L0H684_SPIPD|nr:mannosyl-oligosaccharide glucosidase [Spizellomyces punctatus DAOM BR117]KNC96421.1 hypothetical protein SPPG_08318 [Spizellomyces punctatus DAOM BR117]|eukprot:XP_016604461.1 hypothetical protein SPPG_08318 [Spizellomyces punctatus DAOM BR117]